MGSNKAKVLGRMDSEAEPSFACDKTAYLPSRSTIITSAVELILGIDSSYY
jgi:hypothetical protein